MMRPRRGVAIGVRQVHLKIMDDRADETRREEPGAEWAGCVLAHGRQQR